MLPLLHRKTTLAVASVIIFAAGVGAGAWRYRHARAELLAQLVATVQRCAVAFNPAELQSLTGTPSDLQSPVYDSIKDRLARLRAVDGQSRFVYLFRHLPRTDAVVFLADSEHAAAAHAQPGDPFPRVELSPELQVVVNTGHPATEGPIKDELGTWVTAYALVGPHVPGRPQHIVGVDLAARHWYRTLWSAALGTAGYVWMLLLLPLAALVSTHRQLMQGEALRNLTEAMEQGHSPILIVDLELRIEYANAKFCRLLGYSRRELIGREWRAFLGESIPAEVLVDFVTTIRAGHPWTGEWTMPRKDGTLFPLRAAVTPVKNRNGVTRSFVGVFEDMSEIRRTEAVLREAKERAEAGDRAKGQFLATMSHEVRTPLNGIVGFASLLLDTELTPEQQEYVETIRTSSETLIQLTGDILDYARIESGRLKLEPQPCDVRECIENALDLIAAPALQKNIELLHWIDESVPAAIVADVNRLRQVIVNLVNNAVKFTAQGEVAVEARALPTASGPDAAALCTLEISVRDTGIGIAPEHHRKIFRPFSQVDDSTTRRYGGTGLGLAICKNIVELMDGSISFTSEPGRGSVFTFTIRVPVHTEPATRPQSAPLAEQRVAVVASGAVAGELARLVRRFGGAVIETDLERLSADAAWDLAIVDVTGAQALELSALRKPRPGLPPAKLVALVPMLLPAELRTALRTHFRLILNKPLHHDLLASTLGASHAGAMPAPDDAGAVGRPHPRFDLRVLIVEDNSVNQRLIQNVVTHLGCTWHTSPNGRVALEEIARVQPDVVLMDLHMPELDGLTATMQIRAGDAGVQARDVWIVALTADARIEQRERTLAAGANDYLTKPVRPADLQAAFQRYLAARRSST